MKNFILIMFIIFTTENSFAAKPSEQWGIDVWNTPFGSDRKPIKSFYSPLKSKTSNPWEICVTVPIMNDYWKLITAGIIKQSQLANVKLKIYSANGFKNLDTQKNQIRKCSSTSNALIIGAINYDLLSNYYKEASLKQPLIALSNDVLDSGFFAKTLVSQERVGFLLGEEIKKFFKDKKSIKAIILPGAEGDNWVEVNVLGLKKAFNKSNIKIEKIKYEIQTSEAQNKALQSILHTNDNIDLIIGNSFAASEAVKLLKDRNLNNKIKIASTVMTTDIYKHMKDGNIILSAFDSPVKQGRMALDQAVRALEGKEIYRLISPRIYVVSKNNMKKYNFIEMLNASEVKTNHISNY